jgi:hypothetical protein
MRELVVNNGRARTSTLHKHHKQSLDFIGQIQANEATSGPTVHRAIVHIVAGGTASTSTACLPSVIPHKGHQPVANELNLNSIFKNKHEIDSSKQTQGPSDKGRVCTHATTETHAPSTAITPRMARARCGRMHTGEQGMGETSV